MDEDAVILRYRCRDGRLGQYYSFANVWPPLIFIEVCAAAVLGASHGVQPSRFSNRRRRATWIGHNLLIFTLNVHFATGPSHYPETARSASRVHVARRRGHYDIKKTKQVKKQQINNNSIFTSSHCSHSRQHRSRRSASEPAQIPPRTSHNYVQSSKFRSAPSRTRAGSRRSLRYRQTG